MRSLAFCLVLVCSVMPNVWCQEMRCVKYFTPGDNAQQAAKSVAISPGGEFVVIADGGNRLKVWNSSNGSIVATVGDNANVSAVTFTPEGRRLVLGAVDGSVSSWDSTSWKKVGIWEPHPSSVFCIQFSTNGKQAATGGMDGSIALRNASTGHIDTNLASHNQAINGLAFDGKRNTLLSSSLDEIRVWDSASGTQVSSLKHSDETNGATALAISPTGDYVAAGCPEKNTITIWNLESKTLAHRLVISTSEVTALRFSLDGTQLTSASMDGSIRTWDVQTGKSLGTRKTHAGAAISMSAASKVEYIVTGGSDGEAIVHEGNRTLGILRSHLSQLNGVNYEVDGKYISAHVESPASTTVWRLWPVHETPMIDEPILDARLSLVWHAAIASNGTCRARTFQGNVAIGLRDSEQLWQTDTWRETDGQSIVGVWISETGQSVIAAAHKFIFLWDAKDTSRQIAIPIQADHIANLAVSPDGHVAIVGGGQGLLEAFDLTSHESIWKKQASVQLEKGKQKRPSHINGLRFLRDHTLALLADDCLQIWDSRSGTMLFATTQTKDIDLRVLASSTDGLFATGGYEMRATSAKKTNKQWVVKLWALNEDGRSIRLLREAITGDFEIRHICFAPDNSSIATTDSAGWLRIWDCNAALKQGNR